MKKKKLTVVVCTLLIATSLVFNNYYNNSYTVAETYDGAYPIWIEMMEEPEVNMEEAREAFDTYWEHNTHHKGDKSKSFERWYTINSNRLNEFGNVISAAQVKREFQKMKVNAFFEQKGTWFNYGPINVGARNNGDKRDGGRVKDISFHPTDANTYFVSCFKSGLFKTTDAGSTWNPLTDHLVEEVYTSKVLSSNPNTIYIGTNLGVLKSTDGGVSWNATGLSSGKTNALLIKTDDANVIVIGNDSGIYRSTNGGANFSLVQSASKVEDIKIHPTNPDIMYAGTNGSTSQFFRSTDGGATWTEDTSFGQGAFIKIAVTLAAPNNVYVINSRDHLDQDSFEGVYVSTDSGVNFTKKSSGTPCIIGYDDNGSISRGQPNYNLFITVDPDDANLIYAGGVKSWKSTDGGINWTQKYNNVTTYGFGLHLDQLSWAHSPVTKTLFAVNDGGVYFLNDNDKFQSITDGLPIAEVFECTQSQLTPTNVAGGTMHCGIKLNKDGVWLSPWGGDEATVLYDYSDDTYLYHFKYDKISRSSDAGLSFQRINPTSDKGEYTGTGVLDKSDVNTLFVGLFEVERINNARTATSSQAWDKISSFGGSTKIKKIEQSDADHNILYVSRGGGFYRSDNVRDASPSFTDLSSSLPSSGTINDIAPHPTNANIVYIIQGSQIYKSADKGVTWESISNGLPSVALLEMVYDKSSDEGIYVGTDIGVYYKDATLSSWIDYSEGLPAIRVSGMDIYYGTTRAESFLTVSTDGRGFWRSELNDISTQVPTVGFSADKTSIFTEGEVQFTNESSNVPVGSFLWTFEGGTPETSLEEKPVVIYNTEGSFEVSLSYITDAGVETTAVSNYITVVALPEPIAGFTANKQAVFSGNAISFLDNSANSPTTWSWTFEGGTPASSTEQHPIVIYNDIGAYDVTLKATNSTGTGTKTEIDFVTVTVNTGTGSLECHYNFQGSLEDSSSYDRDLAGIGGFIPTYGTDKDNNATSAFVSSGGTGNYLVNGYEGVTGNGARSVMAWFNTNTLTSSNKAILSMGDKSGGGKGFNLVQHGSLLRIEASFSGVSTVPGLFATGEWHHIAAVFPGSGNLNTIQFYFDGEPVDTDSGWNQSVSINTTSGNSMRIGQMVVGANDGIWDGLLDDVRVYSEALTTQQIADIFAATPPVVPIADFNANETTIVQGEEIQFSDNSSGSPTSWAWVFDGADTANSTAKNPLISYPNPGSYTVSLTVTNNEGTDTKSITDYITVSMAPAPVADFFADKTSVWEGEDVNFTDASVNNSTSWDWTFEGGTPVTSTDQNPTITYTTEGTYKATLIAANFQGSDTKEIADYITVTKPLEPNLSVDNYAVSTASETCRISNNGKINVTPIADYPYTAIVTGTSFNESINFSLASPLRLENVASGTYNICITIDGAPYYEQCFVVVINEPENLSVFSKVDNSKKTVSLKLSGSSSYTISLNDNEFETTDNNVILNLEPNIANVLTISTNKICQGIYEETIILNGNDLFYPNPVSNEFNILLGSIVASTCEVKVSIYTHLGQLIHVKKYKNTNEKITLDIRNLSKGSYVVSVEVDGKIINHKMIKR